MNKSLKLSLKILGYILLLLLLLALGGWWYLNRTFLSFEGDYAEKTEFKLISVDSYSFFDRNGNGKLDPYEDDRLAVDIRVEDALSKMTLEEKLHLLKGSGIASAMGGGDKKIPGAVGTIVPTPRLGLPTIYLSDGPAGLRILPTREGEDRTFYATAFPIGTLLASTWNKALVKDVGMAMGNEAKEYGIDVILGPGANIHRHPLCGRNFEYYSEDPYLTGHIAAAMVNGIESQGVGSSVKHYVANNQETNRNFNDVIVSERAMREIYLKGFEIVVKEAQPWTIMSSYNLVNGEYTSESKYLLTDVLRVDWGFEGLVMSDWFGGSNAVDMVTAGNDLLEPGTRIQWNQLKDGAEDGSLSKSEIDTSVRRILNLIFSSKKMQNYTYAENPDLKAHAQVTRQSASEGMVLLKNENALPLNTSLNIALLGTYSYDFLAGGTGSGDVNEAYSISLKQGLENAGYSINSVAENIYEQFKKEHAEDFVKAEGINAMFDPFDPPKMSYSDAQLNEIAAESDLAILTIGRNSGEGGDRVELDDFLLSAKEQHMIEQAASIYHAQGKKLIVVLNVGGVIETHSWKDKPDAILLAWQGGQEGGNSVSDILSGVINPSGKLPMTFPIHLEDHASNKNFPLEGDPIDMMSLFSGDANKPENEKLKNKDYTLYEEGIYVGYRHFDKVAMEVSYAFGFGLSYTDFEVQTMDSRVENNAFNIEIRVSNKGNFAGKEVVQIYSGLSESEIDRPNKELRAFEKTKILQPGETQILSLSFDLDDLRYWSEEENTWILEHGNYNISIGNSSRAIKDSIFIRL